MAVSDARMAKRQPPWSEWRRKSSRPKRTSRDGADLPVDVASGRGSRALLGDHKPEPTRVSREGVDRSHTRIQARAGSGKRSWIGCTSSGFVRIPSIARTHASAAGSVVMHGTP